VSGYVAALLLTVAGETPLYGVALHGYAGRPWHQALAAGLLVNASSHPVAWLLLYRAAGPGTAAFVCVEVFATAWEAGWLWLWLRRAPAPLTALALAANAVSLALGAVLLRPP
jgi:hypothetical protein